jgi:hypothetical protein
VRWQPFPLIPMVAPGDWLGDAAIRHREKREEHVWATRRKQDELLCPPNITLWKPIRLCGLTKRCGTPKTVRQRKGAAHGVAALQGGGRRDLVRMAVARRGQPARYKAVATLRSTINGGGT